MDRAQTETSARDEGGQRMTYEYKLTVGQLREIAQAMIDRLEDVEDDKEIITSPNTYRMGNRILGTDAGFINYDNIRIKGEPDETEGGDYDY